MKKIVFLFPGQGSQYVGMGRDLFEEYEIARDLFEQASDELKMNMKDLCFKGPESVLIQTDVVQPAVTLINISICQVLKQEGVLPSASAGHSLGEYSALFAAGSIGFIDVMRLVKFRGCFMVDAAKKYPGAMAAVIGLDIEKINLICEKLAPVGSVEVANHNSPGQIIITGNTVGIEKASEEAIKKGAKRVIPLKVSGPWHSKFMHDAQKKMTEILNNINIKKAEIPVIANTTGHYEIEPDLIRDNLIKQITCPVLWVLSMEKFIEDGNNLFVEIGPKKVLRGLLREIDRKVKAYNVEDMVSLEKFLKIINN